MSKSKEVIKHTHIHTHPRQITEFKRADNSQLQDMYKTIMYKNV